MAEILDSGERREFDTGAVRDMAEGKGRCDLIPLDLLAAELQSTVLTELENYRQTRKRHYLHNVLDFFCREAYGGCRETMYLELSKHYEEGAKKYAEDNWKKGIPYHCYVDSAVRHYLKWRRGDTDEHHNRSFVWNIVGLAWTDKHKPEMDDLNPRITYTLDEVIAELELDCTKTERGDKEKAAVSEKVHRKTFLEDYLEKNPGKTVKEVMTKICVEHNYPIKLDCTGAECHYCWNQVMPKRISEDGEDKGKAAVSKNVHRKTYLEDFLENSPTLTAQEVVINLCVKKRYKSIPKTSQLVCDKNCYGCWNSVMPEEE